MPTPIVANGQIDIHYTVSSFEHVCQLRCDIDNPTGSAPFNLVNLDLSTNVWTDFVDRFVLKVKAIYHTSATLDQAILQYWNGSIYVQLDTYSLGVSGTSSTQSTLGGEATFTFKDTTNHNMKIVLLESINFGNVHQGYSALAAVNKAIVDDALDHTGNDFGSAYRSRDAAFARRFIFLTVGTNKKLLRARGLA